MRGELLLMNAMPRPEETRYERKIRCNEPTKPVRFIGGARPVLIGHSSFLFIITAPVVTSCGPHAQGRRHTLLAIARMILLLVKNVCCVLILY